MRVLVIGDSCTDVFIRGKVDRLCPEAPVPIVNPKSVKSNDGMAGNVVANIRSLRPDSNVYFLTQDDKMTKTRYIDEVSGYILLRVDENDVIKKSLTLEGFNTFLKKNGLLIYEFDLVIFSDYNKGFLTESVIKEISEIFACEDTITMLDTKKVLGDWSNDISFVKINAKEYAEQLRHIKSPADHCAEDLIVTLGKDGSKSIVDDVIIKGEEVGVMDVSGAGDTYLSAFAIKYYETRDKFSAMKYANMAASVAVSNHGVVAVKQSELKRS